MIEEQREETHWKSLLACLTVAYLFNFVQLRFANQGLEFWYQTVPKPTWALPTIAVAPLATVLSGFLGVALWKAWHGKAFLLVAAMILVAVLETVWTWLFFVGHHLQAGWMVAGFASLVPLAVGIWGRREAWVLVSLLLISIWLGYWGACTFVVLQNLRIEAATP